MNSIERIKEIFNNKGFVLLDTEINIQNQLYKGMDKDGFLYELSCRLLQDKRTKNSHRYSVNNPYTIENIKHYIKLKDFTCILLSDEFKGNRSKLKFKCECGNEFYRTMGLLRREDSYLCKKCIFKKIGKEKQNSIEKIETLCKNNGYVFINSEENDRFYVCVEDENGYRGKKSICNLDTPIDIFYYKNPYFGYNFDLYCLKNDINCNFVKRLNKDKIQITCSECDNLYIISFSSFLNGSIRCNICSKKQSMLSVKTENWLMENNYKYEKEVSFDDCINIRKLFFDYKVYVNNTFFLLEVDGNFHYNNPFTNDISYQRNNDNIKNEYCLKNNIILLRIPFWHYTNTELYKKDLKNLITTII